MSLYDGLNGLTRKVTIEESISGLLTKTLDKRYKVDQRPDEYYYLIDLVNPAQAYWTRKRRDTPRSAEIANKLSRGNQLHRWAQAWMRTLPGYTSEEVFLRGAYVGINRVVGKIDMRMSNSIIEFKTKPNIVSDDETIISKYPNDLEQLCFYAALHPEELKVNYLIFELDRNPYDITVFKIDIADMGTIRNIIKQRINSLDHALDSSDPSHLHKCRYSLDCDFEKLKICNCRDLSDWPIEHLLRAITITRDHEFEELLTRTRTSYKGRFSSTYKAWNLLAPRKWYMENILNFTRDYDKDPLKDVYLSILQKALIRSDILRVTDAEIDNIRKRRLDLPIVQSWKWIAIPDTIKGQAKRRIIPIVLKVAKSREPPRGMNEAHRIELCFSCVASGCNAGILAVIYPNLDDKIYAYLLELDIDEVRDVGKMVIDSVDSLDMAMRDQNIGHLDVCPSWMQRDCVSCPEGCEILLD